MKTGILMHGRKRHTPAHWLGATLVVIAIGSAQLSVAQQTSKLGNLERTGKLIGKEVVNQQGARLGKLDEIVADLESGRVLYGVVSVDGGKTVGVPPGIFKSGGLDSNGKVALTVGKPKLEGAPVFAKDMSEKIATTSYLNGVYQHFGQTPWWDGEGGGEPFKNVRRASLLSGLKVKAVSGQEIGQIRNLVVNLRTGRVFYVIFAPTGELASGEKVFAIPPNMFTRSDDNKVLVADLDKAKLEGAPVLGPNDWAKVNDPQWASKVYEYYGKQPFFHQGETLSPTSDPEREEQK